MWLEYFAGTENGEIVSEAIKNTGELIVPTITIYEVQRPVPDTQQHLHGVYNVSLFYIRIYLLLQGVLDIRADFGADVRINPLGEEDDINGVWTVRAGAE